MAANNSQLVIKAAILLVLVSLASSYFGTGPYNVRDLQLLACDDQGTNKMNISFQMYRTQDRTKRVLAHRGEITFPAGNEKYNVYCVAYKWGTDWILLTDYKKDLCTSVNLHSEFWAEVTMAIGAKNTCPVEPGRYVFEEWVIGFKPVPPMLPYGKYKVISQFLDSNNEVVGCILAFSEVVKKFV